MRTGEVKRKTAETDIDLKLVIDGSGKSEIKTGSGFFDHMLTLFASHAKFDLTLFCDGDTQVDYHHSVEDIGICLGKAFSQACGDFRGIQRYADITLPMDEVLMLCAIDVSGRGLLRFETSLSPCKIGDFDSELVEEFFTAFVRNFPITLHIKQISGGSGNSHHIAEACFKAFARALSAALSIDKRFENDIPSTKGSL